MGCWAIAAAALLQPFSATNQANRETPPAMTKDIDAVRAAIASNWSNGQTEGQITKLKLIKRQMYGRAKLDLLEARLIATAT